MTTPDGMPPDALRELVREVLRDVLPGLANGAAPPSGIPATSLAAPSAAPPATQATRAAGPIGPTWRDGAEPEPIRLATDEDLHAFVLRVVALADNPKRRRDLMAGRLRFTLAPAAAAGRPADTAGASHIPAAGVQGQYYFSRIHRIVHESIEPIPILHRPCSDDDASSAGGD